MWGRGQVTRSVALIPSNSLAPEAMLSTPIAALSTSELRELLQPQHLPY